ncbi:hypothetical protein [Pseudomonas akapageensis]|uniref:hypothetical protein n=1 Tax=Pseudomonas akapageensis TaxID=2609961 RepID=UPI0014084F1F|nr:hypothetical protein [Pseudomonas akapageensis]
MQVSNSKHPADGIDTTHTLILNERASKVWSNDPMLFQQSRLGLSNDRSRIVLSRYFERYSPTCSHWVEYIHSAPIAEFTQWIMAHGDLRIECSEDLPDTHAHA